MSNAEIEEAEIVKFPGIASISLSVTPITVDEDFDLIEAIVRVYDENDEQIMRQKARSLFTIAKNVKLFIQNRTNLPINDRRMSTWFAGYLNNHGIKIDEEEAYQLIKQASQALEKVSKVTVEHVESTDLVSIESDVKAKLTMHKSERLLSDDELSDLLEQNQCPMSNNVSRTIHYKNSSGADHKDKLSLKIIPAEAVLNHKLSTSFKNETQEDLNEVIISDIIPYCFKILDLNCSKETTPKKELLEDGLKLTWKLASIKSGSEVKFNYTFERRIPRTIMIRKGEEIRFVQDYNSIIREVDEETGREELSFISEVINLLPVTLDELIVRDLIPNELKVIKNKLPEEIELLDMGQQYGITLQQFHTNIETGTKLLQKYFIQKAPKIWKISIKSTKDEVQAVKYIEEIPSKNAYICTLIAKSPDKGTLKNELEKGLKVSNFTPKENAPSDTSNMIFDFEDKIEVSMVLEGKLSTLPKPINLTVNNKVYTAEVSELSSQRQNELISLPFSHVALYRKIVD